MAAATLSSLSLIFTPTRTLTTQLMPGKYNKSGQAIQKQARPVDPQKLYRSLHDQLDRGHLDNALKTCIKRELNPATTSRPWIKAD